MSFVLVCLPCFALRVPVLANWLLAGSWLLCEEPPCRRSATLMFAGSA